MKNCLTLEGYLISLLFPCISMCTIQGRSQGDYHEGLILPRNFNQDVLKMTIAIPTDGFWLHCFFVFFPTLKFTQKAALAAHITLFNEHNERGELHFTNIEHYTHFTSYNGKDTHTDNKIISEILVLHSSALENKTFSLNLVNNSWKARNIGGLRCLQWP